MYIYNFLPLYYIDMKDSSYGSPLFSQFTPNGHDAINELRVRLPQWRHFPAAKTAAFPRTIRYYDETGFGIWMYGSLCI